MKTGFVSLSGVHAHEMATAFGLALSQPSR
jgi:hypothetical protein